MRYTKPSVNMENMDNFSDNRQEISFVARLSHNDTRKNRTELFGHCTRELMGI